MHLWEGDQHHHFTMPVPEFHTDESQEHQRSSSPSAAHESHGPGAIVAPMAGRVVKIFVSDGGRVKKGDSILVLEAMKMEVRMIIPLLSLVCNVLSAPDYEK